MVQPVHFDRFSRNFDPKMGRKVLEIHMFK